MNAKPFLVGSLAAGVILFFWSGLTQVFPWGVPSAKVLISQSAGQTELFQASNARTLAPNELTTPKFDLEMAGRVSTLTTDGTFSWIVSKPLAYYNPTDYFIREIVTQLLVGVLLTSIALTTRTLPIRPRLLVILIAGLSASAGTYGQLFNWWGLTVAYALGASVNLVAGWLIAGFILVRFLIRSA
jgi:hypothetical protein